MLARFCGDGFSLLLELEYDDKNMKFDNKKWFAMFGALLSLVTGIICLDEEIHMDLKFEWGVRMNACYGFLVFAYVLVDYMREAKR